MTRCSKGPSAGTDPTRRDLFLAGPLYRMAGGAARRRGASADPAHWPKPPRPPQRAGTVDLSAEPGGRALVPAVFVFQHAVNEDGADQGKQPDQLRLRGLLPGVEQLRAPHVEGGACLEGDDGEQDDSADDMCSVQSPRKLRLTRRSRKGRSARAQVLTEGALSCGEPRSRARKAAARRASHSFIQKTVKASPPSSGSAARLCST
jgi:hypothetical protein